MSSYFELGMDKKLIVPYADYLKAMKPNFEYVGDKNEILDVVKTLNLPTAHSVKVVADHGTGATSLLDGLSFYQHSSFMPDDFMIRPLFKFNGNNLLNTSDAKVIETRFTAALQELKTYSEQRMVKPVLLIDDGCNVVLNAPQHVINNLVEATVGADYLDVVIVVDKKKEDEFDKKHPEFANSYTRTEVPEPDDEGIFQILKSRAKIHEAKGVHIEDDTLRYMVQVTQRFKAMYDTAQPNRATRLLDSAATGFHMEVHSKAPGAWEKEKQLQTLELDAKSENISPESKDSLNSQMETLRIELAQAKDEWKQKRTGIERIKDEIRKSEVLIASSQKKIEDYDTETRQTNFESERAKVKELDDDLKIKGMSKAEILRLDEKSFLDLIEFDMASHRNPQVSREQQTINNQSANIKNKQKELNALGNLHGTVTMPASEVEKVASAETGVPVGGVSGKLKENLIHGMELMQESVFGQDHVLEPIVESLQRAAAGLNDPNRPLGNFIIGGPPGTGKTWIGKQLAVKLYGSEKFLTVLNMEKFQKDHTVSFLLGAPPGYAGYGTKGKLIEIAQNMPYGVLVLDEIEKAHPDVRQALLTMKSTGLLTGLDGEEADYRNIIIVETSNYGNDKGIWTHDYETGVRLFHQLINEDAATFSPEYLNRADALLCAGPLNEDSLVKIVDREVDRLRKKVAKREVKIEAPVDDLRAFVQARCLKESGRQSEFIINREIGNPLTKLLLPVEGPLPGTLTARFNKDSKAFTTAFLRATVQAEAANAPAAPNPMVA